LSGSSKGREVIATDPMPRRDRLRRVVILCRNFARNLAYYRAGRKDEHRQLFDAVKTASAHFWLVTSANFIDMCVLEWCKLFADVRDRHHWSKIVADRAGFEAALLAHLGLDAAAFREEIKTMRRYRDKFLAHLDSDYTMHIPALNVARAAVWFYHAYVANHEAKHGDLAGLPLDLERGYHETEAEADAVYRRAWESTQ
jgi:hypothetical protein